MVASLQQQVKDPATAPRTFLSLEYCGCGEQVNRSNSYDAFKEYSPPVSSGAVSHLAVRWPRQMQLALIIRNNKRNLQIPVESINLILAWGGKQISP